MPVQEILTFGILIALTILSVFRQLEAQAQAREGMREIEEFEAEQAKIREDADGAREGLLTFEPRSDAELESEVREALALNMEAGSLERLDGAFDAAYALALRHLRRWPELRSFVLDIGSARAQYRRGGLAVPEDRAAVAAELAQYA